MEDIMYRLYVLENIRKGRDDVARGESIGHADLLKEIESW